MDNVVVKVSDLLAKAQELTNAGMKYVSLTTLDGQEYDGETFPPVLQFDAIESDDDFMYIDFESIDLVEFEEDSAADIHISSNLL